RLDYIASLVTESESVSPPSDGGEPALGCDVLEDRHFELECLAATLPRFASMLLCPEGDLDAPDIPTPRSYAESRECSSLWQTAMDAEMASWKSTGTYVDEVPPPGANIVDGMWIFIVKRPSGSPPAFKARYVALGFSQRQGVDFFQTFSPTPRMTTLWVLMHVVALRDYELHSLDFSTTFLQGSLHEEIWLRRPTGFTGSFPAVPVPSAAPVPPVPPALVPLVPVAPKPLAPAAPVPPVPPAPAAPPAPGAPAPPVPAAPAPPAPPLAPPAPPTPAVPPAPVAPAPLVRAPLRPAAPASPVPPALAPLAPAAPPARPTPAAPPAPAALAPLVRAPLGPAAPTPPVPPAPAAPAPPVAAARGAVKLQSPAPERPRRTTHLRSSCGPAAGAPTAPPPLGLAAPPESAPPEPSSPVSAPLGPAPPVSATPVSAPPRPAPPASSPPVSPPPVAPLSTATGCRGGEDDQGGKRGGVSKRGER
ncbi:unnamed protein product, partial [Closterium sp. NIES-54]